MRGTSSIIRVLSLQYISHSESGESEGKKRRKEGGERKRRKKKERRDEEPKEMATSSTPLLKKPTPFDLTKPEDTFNRLDVDGDGTLSKDELMALCGKRASP